MEGYDIRMSIHRSEFERIRSVLDEADADGPLTAREILQVLEAHDEEFESAHRIATVLGRRAQTGEVEVIQDQPYRYQFDTQGT
jgi:predicted Zn-ribbon and HTH transcriptional regulator